MNKKNLLIQLILLIFMSPGSLFAEEFEINSCPSTIDLFDHMSEQVDTRIEGVTANDTSKKIFTTRGNLTSPWVRSSTVWTNNISPIDFTGASPWNSRGGYTRAGTLITPQHIALADHYLLNIGDTVIFITNDNVTISRTITHVQRVGTSDISIAKLNTPVPSSIAHYPIIDKEIFEQYLSDGLSMSTYNLPVIMFDQEDKVLIKNIKKSDLISNNTLDNDYHWQSNRQQFNELLIGGDSGNPGFVLIGDIPALILTHYTSSYGPSYPYYKSDIQDIIDGWGGEYELSSIDLSCFNAPIVLDPSLILEVVENSATGTTLGDINIKYNIDGDTPVFSIVNGNNNGAFLMASSTGEITVANQSLINTNDLSSTIEVQVEEFETGRISSETYIVNFESNPYFNLLNYSFNINEHSVNSTLVGDVGASDLENDTLEYSIVSGNDLGIFSIDSSTGNIRVANSELLDYEVDTSHVLIIRAEEANTVQNLSTDTTVTVTLNDLNYSFSQNYYTFEIDELDEINTLIGTISSSIVDVNNINEIYYRIVYDNQNIFEINSSTGEITLMDNINLNGNNVYNIVVGASDGSSGEVLKSVPVTINVTNQSRPTVSFELQSSSLTTYTVEEGSSVDMNIFLSEPYTKTITVSFAQKLGNANLGSDYTLSSTTITFASGETNKTFSFNALSDSTQENNESVLLEIIDITRTSFGTRKNATVNIINKVNSATVSSGGGSSGGSSSKKEKEPEIIRENKLDTSNTVNTVKNNSQKNFLRDINIGSEGEDVKALQNLLISKGYVISAGVTGYFGEQTRQALIQYQLDNKISPAVGYFGHLTQQSLIGLEQTPIVQNNTVVSADTTFARDLQSDTQGEDVKALQNLLISKGYVISAGVTGYFGEQTRQALIQYQLDNKISPAVGYFGPLTKMKLVSE